MNPGRGRNSPKWQVPSAQRCGDAAGFTRRARHGPPGLDLRTLGGSGWLDSAIDTTPPPTPCHRVDVTTAGAPCSSSTQSPIRTSAAGTSSVLMRGKPITGPSAERGVVFQNYSLLPWLSTYDNVDLAVSSVHPDWSKRSDASTSRTTSRWSISATRSTKSRASSRAACASASRWRARCP